MTCRYRYSSLYLYIQSAAFSLLLLCVSSIALAEPSIRVGLLSPGSPENPFWKSVVDFAEAVAEDLDIKLIVKYSNESSYGIKKNGQRLISKLKDSDYFLTGYYRAVTMDLLQETESRSINTIIFNTDILEADKLEMGKPRQKFRHWIAHMWPDDVRAGYDLASELTRQVQALNKTDSTQTIQALAVTGPLTSSETYKGKIPRFRAELGEEEVLIEKEDSSVSAYRMNGLDQFIQKNKSVNVLGYLDAYWLRDEAKRFSLKALQKYNVKMFWVASDLMAMGVVDASKEYGLTPGKDVVIGGMDWSDMGLKAVSNGDLAVSMGGHFMEAGWALLLMHDYHFGHDFISDPGIEITTKMHALTAKNVGDYLKKFGGGDWRKIDFKRFSKKYNPKLSNYDFSLDAVLKSVK